MDEAAFDPLSVPGLIALTPRLYLRQLTPHDLTAMLRVFGDPDVMRYGDGVHDRSWTAEWLENAVRRYQEQGYGPYGVASRSTHQIIGYCGLFDYPDIAGKPEVEIGYRLERDAWGQGFATEAARAVRDFAFDALGIKHLIALIDPANTASIRVAQKLGMRREGAVMLPGYTHPDHVYGVYASEQYLKASSSTSRPQFRRACQNKFQAGQNRVLRPRRRGR